METVVKVVGLTILGLGIAFLLSALLAWPLMWLGNVIFAQTVLISLFGTGGLTFWKAFGLLFFFRLLLPTSTAGKS